MIFTSTVLYSLFITLYKKKILINMNYIVLSLSCYYVIKFVSLYFTNYHYWENKTFAANSGRKKKFTT